MKSYYRNYKDMLEDFDSYECETTCPKCGKTFTYVMEEQTPGFKDAEDLICPYCRHVIRTSMEYEFTSYTSDL